MMRKALITGCSGFLGGHLAGYLVKKGYRVTGFTEEESYRSEDIRVVHCDILDREGVASLLKAERPEVIFHLAALASVGRSWKRERQTYEVNFLGTLHLIEALKIHCPEARLVLMGSAEVYGRKTRPVSERSGIDIRSPYALSKYAMELLGDLHARADGVDMVKVRAFNFTGPGQARGFVIADFASQIARIERGRQPPVIRTGDLSVRRDFSDVRDIVRYLRAVDRQGVSNRVYNLCSGRVVAIRDLLEMLLRMSDREIQVVRDPEKIRPVDIPLLWGNNRRIREELRLGPRYDLELTLRDILEYWRGRD